MDQRLGYSLEGGAKRNRKSLSIWKVICMNTPDTTGLQERTARLVSVHLRSILFCKFQSYSVLLRVCLQSPHLDKPEMSYLGIYCKSVQIFCSHLPDIFRIQFKIYSIETEPLRLCLQFTIMQCEIYKQKNPV